jgi:hypothetical protein
MLIFLVSYIAGVHGGQTFLLKGQIWNLIITVGLNFKLTNVTHEIFAEQKIFWAIFSRFVHFLWLLREK